MRFNASEKFEIIRMVEESDLSVKLTLNQLDIPKSVCLQTKVHRLMF